MKSRFGGDHPYMQSSKMHQEDWLLIPYDIILEIGDIQEMVFTN